MSDEHTTPDAGLPRTEFPRRRAPAEETALLRRWEAMALYRRALAQTDGGPRFMLHSRPTAGTDGLGYTELLRLLLQDFTVKFRALQGYHAPHVIGWDVYGLGIEIAVLRTFATARHAVPAPALRRRCALLARQHCTRQWRQLRRLGIRADWRRPYLTLYPEYAGAVLAVFRRLVEEGLVTRAEMPVTWCPTCAVSLAAVETAPLDRPKPVAWVAFPVHSLPAGVLPREDRGRMAVAVHTDRVWTLPAVTAVTMQAAADYVLITDREDVEGFTYLVAREARDAFTRDAKLRRPAELDAVRGAALAEAVLLHPLTRAAVPLVPVDAVAGLHLLAPGHNRTDFSLARALGLPAPSLLDAAGCYTAEAGALAGVPVEQGATRILRQLDRAGVLLGYARESRPVPHCWRCRQPVITRCAPHWLLNTTSLCERAAAAAAPVRWQPAWSAPQLAAMLRNRPDWCLSRRRAWGVPIPAVVCAVCATPRLTPEIVAQAADIIRAEGADAWFTRPVADLLPPGAACPACGGTAFRIEHEVFDGEFVAACSAASGSAEPADLVLAGHDQVRGWLQHALLAAVGADRSAPYRAARVHGVVLDRLARVRRGDAEIVPEPMDLVDRYGADVVRWWAASVDARADVPLTDAGLAQAAREHQRIRGVLRRVLAHLRDVPSDALLADAAPAEADRWLLDRLRRLVDDVTTAHEAGLFHRGTRAIAAFCARVLSAVYLPVAEPRLRLPDVPARRAAQAALYHAAVTLAVLLAPTASFLADDLWVHLPAGDRALSVQLAEWPVPPASWRDDALAARWAQALALVRRLRRLLIARGFASARARALHKIVCYAGGELLPALESVEDALASLLGVGAVECAPRDAAPAAVLLEEAEWAVALVRASSRPPGVE